MQSLGRDALATVSNGSLLVPTGFFFLKEGPVVIEAKALSLTAWC